jgi:hypothetical protein
MGPERWNATFYEADARFWPIAPAARRFAAHDDFPLPAELSLPGLDFVAAPKPRRTRQRPRPAADGYDERILRGEVPTRPRSWHDFLNALVWATFPESKRAVHALQADALRRARTLSGELRGHGLPNARARDHDALALLDEGGVLVLATGAEEVAIGFGHALYEGLVRGGPPATASCLRFTLPALPAREALTALADRLLAERLREPLTPAALSRVPF